MLRPLSVLLALAPLASAATLFVDATNPACPGTGTALDPFCTIQAAIDAASDGDLVSVAPGTYAELIDFGGKAIVVASSEGAAVTTIVEPGFPGPAGSVVTFDDGETRDAELRGFTLTGGSGTVVEVLPGFDVTAGGAVFCVAASPTVADCTIASNVASRGAGAYCDGGEPLLRGNVIRVNGGDLGAGVYATGGALPVISENEIADNAVGGVGGGLFLDGGAGSVSANTIAGNVASVGAGLFVGGGSSVRIEANRFEGNSTDEDEGGAILCEDASPLIVDNEFVDNSSFSHGGAIAGSQSQAQIVGNLFRGNDAQISGGAYASQLGAADVLRGNTFDDNGAGFGGAIGGSGGAPQVLGNVFTANRGSAAIRLGAGLVADCLLVGSEGAGVDADGTLVLRRTTITASAFDGVFVLGGAPTIESCIVYGNGPFFEIFVESGAPTVSYCDVLGGFPGVGNLDADPLFATDYSLSPGSPCIDAGAPDDAVCGVDLALRPRRVDGLLDGGPQVDMGAFEFSHLSLAVTPPAGPGGSLVLETDGLAGLAVLQAAAAVPGPFCTKKFGTVLFDPFGPFVLVPTGTVPGTLSVALPPALPPGEIVLQAIGVQGSRANASNAALLTLP